MKVGVRAGGEPGGRPGDGGRVGARRYPVKLTPQKNSVDIITLIQISTDVL